ncbi:MAG: hypothetical protein WDN06_19400 [Asticcacaulis sp.]
MTLGADNLFDVYPDKTPAGLNTTSGNGVGALAFTRFSPFGFKRPATSTPRSAKASKT